MDFKTQKQYNPKLESSKGFGLASILIGVLSFATMCFWPLSYACMAIGLTLGIIGIVKSRKNQCGSNPTAIAGIAISTVSFIISMLIMIALNRIEESLTPSFMEFDSINRMFYDSLQTLDFEYEQTIRDADSTFFIE